MAFSHNYSKYGNRPSLKILKTELRTQYLAKRKAIPADKKKELDAAICRRLAATVSFRFADTVMLYSALPSEIDMTEIINLALSQGKRVLLPRCIPDTPLMNFHEVKSVTELTKGSFSIMEPSEDAPVCVPTEADKAICIIPGVLFDPNGHRVGYGKGYYDRYLSDKPVQKIGVVYDDFILHDLPHGRYDLSVDLIITEKRLVSVNT